MGGRALVWLVPVVLMTGGCASTVGGPADSGSPAAERTPTAGGSPPAGRGPAVGVEAGEPPLVGTSWQLSSYRAPAAAAPVRVTIDSTLSFSAGGRFSVHACNWIDGTARIEGRTVIFGRGMTTLKGCAGEEAALQDAVLPAVTGTADWSIRDRTLTVTNRDGHVLTYRVRPSKFPSLTARALATGARSGGEFRLAVDGPADRPFLVFETRTAPGEAWGTAGVMSPEPDDCLANHILAGGRLGNETFVAAWATPDVARVTTRAARGREVPLAFYRIPGSTLRIAGRWTTGFRPGNSPVTFYDRRGAVLAAYPNGPC
jgi:heat shock protein HslJ